jgi:hypothetical protein
MKTTNKRNLMTAALSLALGAVTIKAADGLDRTVLPIPEPLRQDLRPLAHASGLR